MNLAANPAKPLESHSCTQRTHNPLRITFLRKNRGRGPFSARHRAACASIPRRLDTKLFDDLHLGDWIHHPSNRMQESPAPPLAAPRLAISFSCKGGACSARRQREHDLTAEPRIPQRCRTAAHQSSVDTTRRFPYSAPANDFASPSPPSSSRHSAALDDVCIAIRYHTVLITRWRNGPAGFLFLRPLISPEAQRRKRQDRNKSQNERTRCNSTSPNPTD